MLTHRREGGPQDRRRPHDVVAEDGVAEGVQGVSHGEVVEIDGPVGLVVLFAPGHEIGRRRRHRVEVVVDGAAGEQRLGDAPVPAPSFPLADQKPVAEEVPELADYRSILDVMPGVSGEDLMGAFGDEHGVEGETNPWRADAKARDVAVGGHGLGVGTELVALEVAGAAQQQRAAS